VIKRKYRPRFGARKLLRFAYRSRPIKRGPLPEKVRLLYYRAYSRAAHRNGGGFIPVRYIRFEGDEIGSYQSFRFIESPVLTFGYTEEAARMYEETHDD
jgi:hypothetical protein